MKIPLGPLSDQGGLPKIATLQYPEGRNGFYTRLSQDVVHKPLTPRPEGIEERFTAKGAENAEGR